PNETGAMAEVQGICQRSGKVVFQAKLLDADDPKNPLGLMTQSGGIIGNKRINDEEIVPTIFPTIRWRNQIEVSSLSYEHDDPEAAETTWRVLSEVETSAGTLTIEIPTFDANIQKLIVECKKRYEIVRRLGNQRDAPVN